MAQTQFITGAQYRANSKRERTLQETFTQDPLEDQASSGDMETSSDETLFTSDQRAFEEFARDECKMWLANTGRALFALECQRFLVNERKRKDIAAKR